MFIELCGEKWKNSFYNCSNCLDKAVKTSSEKANIIHVTHNHKFGSEGFIVCTAYNILYI